MKKVVCAKCNRPVFPMSDGRCPGCLGPLEASTDDAGDAGGSDKTATPVNSEAAAPPRTPPDSKSGSASQLDFVGGDAAGATTAVGDKKSGQTQTDGKEQFARVLRIMLFCSPLFYFGCVLMGDALLALRGPKVIGYIDSMALFQPSYPRSVDFKELAIAGVLFVVGIFCARRLARSSSADGGLWIDRCRYAMFIPSLVVAFLFWVDAASIVVWVLVVALVSWIVTALHSEKMREKWLWTALLSLALYVFLGGLLRLEIKRAHWFTSNQQVVDAQGQHYDIRSRLVR